MRLLRLAPILAVACLLASCAARGPRFETAGVAQGLTPQEVVAQPERLRGTDVLWGGVIVASVNLPEATRFEILSYPLDDNQQPNLDARPQGRFLAMERGYVETADFRRGRAVTLKGTLTETESGRIGQARYVYPVVEVERTYLWPETPRTSVSPRVHFGIGVIFSD